MSSWNIYSIFFQSLLQIYSILKICYDILRYSMIPFLWGKMSANLDFKRTFQYFQALYSVVRFSLKLFFINYIYSDRCFELWICIGICKRMWSNDNNWDGIWCNTRLCPIFGKKFRDIGCKTVEYDKWMRKSIWKRAVKGALFFLQLWNGKIITLYTVYIK